MTGGGRLGVTWPRRQGSGANGGIVGPETAAAIAVSAGAFALVAYLNVRSNAFGFDFRGNPWQAARAVLHGHSPYAHLTESYFRSHSNAYLLPPLLAVLAAPLGALPFAYAFALWTVLSVVAFAAALWLVGLRSRPCYALAFLSFPLLDNLVLGQLSAFMALGYAVVWRSRDHRYVPGIVVAFLIVLKLLAWPLLFWFVFSRRWRAAASGLLAVPVLAIASWAVVGFHGIPDFVHGLAIDARASSAHTHSVVAVVMAAGAPQRFGTVAAIAVGLAFLIWACRKALTRQDIPAFGAAIAAGIYMSPIVHPHYLLLILVVLAVAQPRPSWTWLALVGLWLSTSEPSPTNVSLYASFAVAFAIVLSTIRASSSPAGKSPHLTDPPVAVVRHTSELLRTRRRSRPQPLSTEKGC